MVNLDPPNCACGTVTLDRINTLLTGSREGFGSRNIFPQQQVIFPNIHFTDSGKLLMWIVGGTYISQNPMIYPELQLWRQTGSTTYQKVNGTTLTAPVAERSGIYRFPVQHLSFQPGDVLGLFQPPLLESRLLVDYDTGDNPIVYYLPLSSEQLEPVHTVVDIRDLQTANNLPLVSVVIGK